MDHDHCNHWIPLLATFDIPPSILMILCSKIKNHYYATPLDHDLCNLQTPLLATSILRLDLPVTLCAPACGSPPATSTPSAFLPATAVTTITSHPCTCHLPPSSLSLLCFPFFAAGPLSIPVPRPPPPRQDLPPPRSSLPLTARRHLQQLFIPDEF